MSDSNPRYAFYCHSIGVDPTRSFQQAQFSIALPRDYPGNWLTVDTPLGACLLDQKQAGLWRLAAERDVMSTLTFDEFHDGRLPFVSLTDDIGNLTIDIAPGNLVLLDELAGSHESRTLRVARPGIPLGLSPGQTQPPGPRRIDWPQHDAKWFAL
ncbi:hypothetical protein RM531_08040 [Salinisphaera sp. P385]|uniref:Uncharacterized protein n=1 Tax=Spectribacter acetivorans TaxID=3075603 RepID=A0ABU3B7J1_9GAMM|nr:hypothetical protein [Salinisphaera sp. P385]MDT0618424.1 hypothetical protein [Salinisphaera sp. P385]